MNLTPIKLLFWNIDRPTDVRQFIPRIVKNDPDVIVLVEARLKKKEGKRSILVGIKPFKELTKVYDYIIHEPKDVPGPGEDGIIIFWKKDKFEYLESIKHFEIPNENPVKAIYVKLKHVESGKLLCFLPIHLKAGYRSGEDRRVAEIQHCLEFLKNRKECERVVICGDFNDDLKDERKLSSVLKRENFKIWDGGLTCFVLQYWSFDRIVTLGNLGLKYINDPINEECVGKAIPLPNGDIHSDHLPVEVYLSFQ
jgi:exonuclease III